MQNILSDNEISGMMYQLHPVPGSSYLKWRHFDGFPIANCCQVLMTDPIQADKIESLKQM